MDITTGTLLLIPLVSAATILLFFRQNGKIASYVSVAAAGAILLLSLQIIFSESASADSESGDAIVDSGITWLEIADFKIVADFQIDDPEANNESKALLFVVSFVGFLIHVFSLGYMADDAGKARYFGGLSIFMFSMLGITLADNLIMIFVFWELVGFSSYMLIAHYFHTKEASDASKKAFIVNRVGDFGFLIGIVLTYWMFGTVNLSELSQLMAADPARATTGIALALACGFIGKSAQFPLQVWLPDAMAGPTPVSALIHAATMVAAGIYLLARIDFLFTPEALSFIALLGAAMGLYAGFCALVQRDIKKILAYSTLSQLGYMAAAFGLGLEGVALFHLATHAFFKGLMFLGAGSVIHSCHHEQDIFKMGGLRSRMPVTANTFLIGVLAISGVNFFSGYFSKDAILLGAYNLNLPVFVVLYLGAILTAFYMFRLYWIAFCGEPRSKHVAEANESPSVMTWPLIILAVLSAIGGFEALWPEALFAAFHTDLHVVHGMPGHLWMVVLGTFAWVAGALGSRRLYGQAGNEDPLMEKAPALFQLCSSKLFFDEIYNFYVTSIQQRVARILEVLELLFISGLMVRGSAGAAGLFALFGKSFYLGRIHGYAFWFLIGVVGFLAYAAGWFGHF
jgi:NADH-quinone oxidoreductase subunit L